MHKLFNLLWYNRLQVRLYMYNIPSPSQHIRNRLPRIYLNTIFCRGPIIINQSNKSWNLRFMLCINSSVESQKGVTSVQMCSVENQKGAIAVQSIWRSWAPFWFSTEHFWTIMNALLALNWRIVTFGVNAPYSHSKILSHKFFCASTSTDH